MEHHLWSITETKSSDPMSLAGKRDNALPLEPGYPVLPQTYHRPAAPAPVAAPVAPPAAAPASATAPATAQATNVSPQSVLTYGTADKRA